MNICIFFCLTFTANLPQPNYHAFTYQQIPDYGTCVEQCKIIEQLIYRGLTNVEKMCGGAYDLSYTEQGITLDSLTFVGNRQYFLNQKEIIVELAKYHRIWSNARNLKYTYATYMQYGKNGLHGGIWGRTVADQEKYIHEYRENLIELMGYDNYWLWNVPIYFTEYSNE